MGWFWEVLLAGFCAAICGFRGCRDGSFLRGQACKPSSLMLWNSTVTEEGAQSFFYLAVIEFLWRSAQTRSNFGLHATDHLPRSADVIVTLTSWPPSAEEVALFLADPEGCCNRHEEVPFAVLGPVEGDLRS